jgi:hypothetical protein
MEDKETRSSGDNAENNGKKSFIERLIITYWINPLRDIVTAISEQDYDKNDKETNPAWRQYRTQRCSNTIAIWAIVFNFILTGAIILLYLGLYNQSGSQFHRINEQNICIGEVGYYYDTVKHAPPLRPHEARMMYTYITNLSNLPIHLDSFRAKVFFDTAGRRVDSFVNAMQKADFKEMGWISARNSNITNFRDTMNINPSQVDCDRMQTGAVTYYLEIRYRNDITNKTRKYIAISTLKDHHGPPSLTDQIPYNENADLGDSIKKFPRFYKP